MCRLAIRRSAVTVIIVFSHRGPAWWQRSVQTFAGVTLALLLGYACWRSTQYALSGDAVNGVGAASDVSKFYPIASMALGYYFITLHYLTAATRAAVGVVQAGRDGARRALQGLAGGLAIGALIWGACSLLLDTGISRLIVLGIVFVALTLAGMPDRVHACWSSASSRSCPNSSA